MVVPWLLLHRPVVGPLPPKGRPVDSRRERWHVMYEAESMAGLLVVGVAAPPGWCPRTFVAGCCWDWRYFVVGSVPTALAALLPLAVATPWQSQHHVALVVLAATEESPPQGHLRSPVVMIVATPDGSTIHLRSRDG